MSKILCIYTLSAILCPKNKPIRYITDIPQGLSYIMSFLRQKNIEYDLLVFSQKNNIYREIKRYLSDNDIDIVLITSVSSQYFFVKKIAYAVKNIDKNIRILIGGVHATLRYKELLKEDCFDAVCVGDGEIAVAEYIYNIRNKIFSNKINNIYIKENNKIIAPENILFIENLDDYPFPERDIWKKWIAYNARNEAFVQVLVSRGCPNICSYCSNHAISKISDQKYVRYRKIDSVIEEIKSLDASKILLNTENIAININYFNKLSDAIIKNNLNKKKEFACDINIGKNILNENFFAKIAAANIRTLSVGLESGSVSIRRNILKRPEYTNDDFKKFCILAKKYNIIVCVYVLVGIPYETNLDFLETVKILREAQPDFIREYIYSPYPSTDLYNRLIKDKILSSEDKFIYNSQERLKVKFSYPGMSKFRIQWNYFTLLYRVYIGHKSFVVVCILTLGTILYTYNKFVPDFLYQFLEKLLRFVLQKINVKL